MPGLTCCSTPLAESQALRQRFDEAQTTMLHAPDYSARIDIARAGCIIGHVAYPEYPVQVFTSGTQDIYLEGRIYNVRAAALESDLKLLADRVFKATGRSEFVRNWIIEHDGEYVVVIADRNTQEIAILTDPLGRLPVYYHFDETSLIVARECKFILSFLREWEFDRIGCAQFLWAGYPLGRRTHFADVSAAPSAMLLLSSVDGHRLKTSVSTLIDFNLEDKETASKTPDQYASELVETIVSTTADRARHPDVTTNVISLSGGWDSRIIATALARSTRRCVAVTYVNAEGRGEKDAQLAMQIAKILEMPCEFVRIRPVRPEDEERLVSLTDGLNYVSMAYNLPFMEEVVSRWGRRAAYLTGDGGPQIISLKGLRTTVQSMDRLVEEIIGERSILPITVAEDVMGLGPGTLTDELRNVVSKYPESDFNQKGAHFAIFERGRRWGFEGEDRARFYMWQTSPFYSYPFYRCGTRIPDRFKRDNKMYRLFQIKLSPSGSRIPDASTGIPPSSPLLPYAYRLKRYLLTPHNFRRSLKPFVLRGEFGRSPTPEQALSYVHELELLGEGSLMGGAAVRRMLASANKTQYANWWTVALLDKLIRNGKYGSRTHVFDREQHQARAS